LIPASGYRRQAMGLFQNLFGGGGKGKGTPGLEINNINLEKKNSWDNPQIALWLANPIGFGNRKVDAKLPLEGIVTNAPAEGFVRIFVVLSKDGSIWPQWDSKLDRNGAWKGGVYLATGMGENYKKTILIQVYEVKEGNEGVKILEEEYVIE
jgi:hypothetical protein